MKNHPKINCQNDYMAFLDLKVFWPKVNESLIVRCFRCVEEVGLLRRVDNCLKRVKLVSPPAGTKGTSQPDEDSRPLLVLPDLRVTGGGIGGAEGDLVAIFIYMSLIWQTVIWPTVQSCC